MNKFFDLIIYSTIALSTVISSYATYLGFLVVKPLNLSIALALVSGLILMSLSLLVNHIYKETYAVILKAFLFVIILCVIFSFSTLWSIIGIAKEELLLKQATQAIEEFTNKYTLTNVYKDFNEVIKIHSVLEEGVELSYKNAIQGKYTGEPGKGIIAKNLDLLQTNVSQKNRQLQLLSDAIKLKKQKLDDELEIILRSGEHLNKDTFISAAKSINSIIDELEELLNFRILVNQTQSSLNSVLTSLQTAKEYVETNTSRSLIAAEMGRLESYIKALDIVSASTPEPFPHLDVQTYGRSIVAASFTYMTSIINWWAICLVIDFVPMVLLWTLSKNNEGFVFD